MVRIPFGDVKFTQLADFDRDRTGISNVKHYSLHVEKQMSAVTASAADLGLSFSKRSSISIFHNNITLVIAVGGNKPLTNSREGGNYL